MDYATLSADELVIACGQSDDPAAWQEFVQRFHRLIATVALRVARRWGEPSPQVIDDLVQETYLKLCADNFQALRAFKPHHPDAFYGYLKVVTANLVHDHFKAAHSSKRGSDTIQLAIDAQPTSSKAGLRAVSPRTGDREILMREIDATLSQIAAGPQLQRSRRIFWLYYRVGLTANAIAALPYIGLSTKGVESTILRLTRLLREELDRSQPKGGADESNEFHS
jgi:RNA polymerase sigma factor (sigma-70 family)